MLFIVRMHLGIQSGFIMGCNSRNKSSIVKSYRQYRFIVMNLQNIPVINGQEFVYSLLKGSFNHKENILIALVLCPHLLLCTTEAAEITKVLLELKK